MHSQANFNRVILMEGTIWSDGSDDELVRELLDDVSPFFPLPQERNESKASPSSASSINQLMPTAHLGPRIEDIENALSVTQYKHHFQAISEARVSILEKGLNKGDNKYTLRIKCCSNNMADDGYKWRKYGQKSIKNSPYPRSYYRCNNPRCGAKKQVERSTFDPETVIITYEGLHLHYAYPYFLSEPEQANPPAKKLRNAPISQAQAHQTEAAQESPECFSRDPLPRAFMAHKPGRVQEEMSPQGMLEDVVPFMIRNPSNRLPSSSSSSSQDSPPTSPSSPSWSPTYSAICFHTGV